MSDLQRQAVAEAEASFSEVEMEEALAELVNWSGPDHADCFPCPVSNLESFELANVRVGIRGLVLGLANGDEFHITIRKTK